MLQLDVEKTGSEPQSVVAPENELDDLHDAADLESVLAEIQEIVPPLWPLQDYVAVNPFLGLSQQRFLDARQTLCAVRDCELVPGLDYFRTLLERGEISHADITTAYRQCTEEYPSWYAELDPAVIVDFMTGPATSDVDCERHFYTVAEIVDRRSESSWSGHIVNDITRHCGAHYDAGQASWGNPWKDVPLYEAWHEAAQLSYRIDMLGVKGFRAIVAELPETAAEAVAHLLGELGIPRRHWKPFLLCELFSVSGWASFVRYLVREAAAEGRRSEDLIGLLAIRLAYDLALARNHDGDLPSVVDACYPAGDIDATPTHVVMTPPPSVLTRYALQLAAEAAFRRRLCTALLTTRGGVRPPSRKTAQMIFCIDVRSEVMRRHLESVSEEIETFGFAGFFGMALEYIPLGETAGPAQCPALLRPGFRVPETLQDADEGANAKAIRQARSRRVERKLWKSFQTSASSCFSFVESLGLTYIAKLVADSLPLTRSATPKMSGDLSNPAHSHLGPNVNAVDQAGLPCEKKIDLAEGMLRNLGLTEGFARIVVVCGHAAEVVNNPYKAGLDCGACGGHSGEPNARVAAAMLNDRHVRTGLSDRGIDVPEDTWFVPAVHNTTTDEIRLLDTVGIPNTHVAELQQLNAWTREAGELTRVERSARLGRGASAEAFRRSRDWSEVRPEWGLAGNAAFIVAPRRRTAGLDLGGRSFLHSYDHHKDPDLKVLELIMTAPMIVTNWINLQYYASAVDNRAFGSGNKAIHNVVGQMGILQGNGGDLMTGLPWQSVHDGQRLQHEPLRLSVVIEAPRDAVRQIIDKHELVRDLASNGWLSLVVVEDEQPYSWAPGGGWRAEEGGGGEDSESTQSTVCTGNAEVAEAGGAGR